MGDRSSILPSGAAGKYTRTVGYFEYDTDRLAAWLRGRLGASEVRAPGWDSLAQAAAELATKSPLSRRAVIPIATWTVMLTDGPLGTDLGLLPSQAAETLGIRALRAVCSEDDEPGYSGRMLSLYGPNGEPPFLVVRSIAAVNDGGRWLFENFGAPQSFERVEQYRQRRSPATCSTSTCALSASRWTQNPTGIAPCWSRRPKADRRARRGACTYALSCSACTPRPEDQGIRRRPTKAGPLTSAVLPSDVSAPVAGSIRKPTTWFASWLPA